jgi:pilus assembly protein CpaB
MKSRAIIPLIVGLGVGVLAIRMFTNVLQKAQGASTKTDMVTVVVASTDIDPTLEITEVMVTQQEIPSKLAPPQSISDPKEAIGRVAGRMIPQGMTLVPGYLAPPGTPPGMAVRIREGFRAVAVKVDESTSVAGWIKPGSRVDVVILMDIRRDGKRETISRVILENIEVLAVGQDIGTMSDTGASVAKSVTLLVPPEDVPKLHLAATKGKVRLAMRNQLDNTGGRSVVMTDNDLLGVGKSSSKKSGPSFFQRLLSLKQKVAAVQTDKEKRQPVPAAEPEPVDQPYSIEVVRGEESEVVWFDTNNRHARRLLEGEPRRTTAGQPTVRPVEAVAQLPAEVKMPDLNALPDLKNLPEVRQMAEQLLGGVGEGSILTPDTESSE